LDLGVEIGIVLCGGPDGEQKVIGIDIRQAPFRYPFSDRRFFCLD
jgi:hypothetical protein